MRDEIQSLFTQSSDNTQNARSIGAKVTRARMLRDGLRRRASGHYSLMAGTCPAEEHLLQGSKEKAVNQ